LERIRKATFRYIESELRHYHEYLDAIDQRRVEIMNGSSPQQEGGRGSLPGKPTEAKAVTLVMDRQLEQWERIVNAIQSIVTKLDDSRYRLVELYYWTNPQLLTWDGIALDLHVSRRQAITWRDQIIIAIAERMGMK
jgi:RinA family phage transcriptional activator